MSVESGASKQATPNGPARRRLFGYGSALGTAAVLAACAPSGGPAEPAGKAAVRLGLVDEYHLHVHPVVSAGKTWFDQIEGRHNTELLSATSYPDGVVSLHYRPRAG